MPVNAEDVTDQLYIPRKPGGFNYDHYWEREKGNMTNALKAGLLGVTLIFSANCNAGAFVGVGASLLSADDGSDAAEPVNAILRAGFALNQYFEIGGELGYTVIEDDVL